MTIGTIVKAAKDAGYTYALSAQSVSENSPGTVAVKFTGSGGDEENGKLFAGVFRNRLLYIYETGDWLWFSPQQGWVSAQHVHLPAASPFVDCEIHHRRNEARGTRTPILPFAKRALVQLSYRRTMSLP